jgi:hypothetical protein
LLGEKTVEALPAILLPDRQRLRGIGHGTSLVGRVATRQSEPWRAASSKRAPRLRFSLAVGPWGAQPGSG